jgi:hypothetical protein
MTKSRDLANAATALSAVSATELAFIDGVTSAVQTQIDGKQAINANVSTTELGYLDGVTSAIQTQLDAKIAKTLTTTTGDIIYASGANTPARLGIGSSAQVLTVSSGVPAWATPAGGSGPGFAVYMASNQTGMSDSVAVKLNMDTEDWDSDSCYDTTNKRFTPTKAGWYQFNIRASSTLIHTIYLYKNNTTQYLLVGMAANDSNPGSGLVYMNGTTDYVEMWGMVQTAAGTMTAGTLYTRFEGFFVR